MVYVFIVRWILYVLYCLLSQVTAQLNEMVEGNLRDAY